MRGIILTVGLLLSAGALAEDCGNAATQLAMNECAAGEYQAADKKLNDTYATVLQRATGETKARVKTAQQKWIALRDADCALVASGTEGGSVQPMIRSQCLTEKTVERTAWLESLLNCEEGDLSCPLPPAG
ncbi:lysozyme inhibitor LprI family protein [Pluralibacter gergoviae]|uniref:Lysozyme inhibitor LprI family protein n=2 Tax=Pluralibacter gergoviae TaxID=61647 RepID=A0A089R5N6_PLUGE|nr:lysozyme inhibitor LprI family protein [Pluralibacter gergoviae]AIR01900.1 hypothetical protein LG71_19225 [Pluralibacter gergoviae]AVR03825.1 DUF1311 domain-containing protein [Pluralibacter gergoviae]EKV0917100.1 lysozyme inhibitor LprI family protein [Pluralibacter gergoviae]EKV0928522.1 lysozyme inhibitor LprI family protein [Pluralibacter gergoviae]EKV6247903.1 lysozyme inhibitor LprI family protein [Pluralibacter gergoviae]